MAREEHESDFSVEVQGIGTFRFGRRRKEDTYKIRSAYGKMTDHNYREDGTAADMEAWIDATLQVLTVSAPDGFSLPDFLDPLTSDDSAGEKLVAIYTKLREKELSFRPTKKEGSAGTG
jgi:hypothetical protein